MAAKRIAASSVDWAEFASRIHPSMQAQFSAFKSQCANYARIVNSKKDSIQQINFDDYKAAGLDPKLVDSFKSQYASLQVPYPSSKQYIDKLEDVKKADIKDIQQETVKSEERIVELKKFIDYYEKMPIPALMTADELLYYYPTYTFNWRIPETFDVKWNPKRYLYPSAPDWKRPAKPDFVFQNEYPNYDLYQINMDTIRNRRAERKQLEEDEIRLAELEALEAQGKLPEK